MKTILHWCIAFILSGNAFAQSPVTTYTFHNITSVPDSTASGRGWNASGGTYLQSTNYTMNFGRSSSSSNGMEREIQSFNVGTRSYSRVNGALSEPFTRITINRHPGMVGDTINTFYEFTSPSGNNVYLTSQYTPDLDDIINSKIVNRGSDNLFSNSPTTQANIERVDMINANGIYVINAAMQGFLINERGGNDNFKLAAITGINGSQVVTSLGNLTSVSSSTWGQVGPSVNTLVMSRRMGADPNLRPKQEITAQNISGIYVSFADLGIANGATIYGFVLFPNDVNASMNLISLTNVPTNTNQGTDGGLDLMAGMGYFAENSLLPNLEWNFQLKKSNGQISLNWNNIFSDNVKSFLIERSDDGKHFSTIGERRITGNLNTLEYNDAQSADYQKIYYRIKAIKHDGSYMYSNILFLAENPSIHMTVFPNPFTDFVQTEISSENIQKVRTNWLNASGKILKEDYHSLNRGFNLLRLEAPTNLSAGKYFLQIILDDGRRKMIQVVRN